MSDVLIGGLIAIGSAVLGGAVTGFFAVYQNWAQERHEGQSIRTLLSLEIVQNVTALSILHDEAEDSLRYRNPSNSAIHFLIKVQLPQWQTVRWKTEAVGRHLKPSELMRIGELYTRLDGVTLLYQRTMTQLQLLPKDSDGRIAITTGIADNVVEEIQSLIMYAAAVIDNSPPLPDAKLDSGESIADYLAELQQRQPKTSAPSEASVQE